MTFVVKKYLYFTFYIYFCIQIIKHIYYEIEKTNLSLPIDCDRNGYFSFRIPYWIIYCFSIVIFISYFMFISVIPVEECSAENSEWSEICLNGKEIFLSDALSDYKKGIKRSRKMPQTERLVQLNKKRIKLLSGIIAYIRSCSNHFDPKIISSSQLYLNYLKEFNRFYEGSRSSLSATIRKFINTVENCRKCLVCNLRHIVI